MLFVSRITGLLSARACQPDVDPKDASFFLAVTASTPDQPGSTGVIGDYTSGYMLTPQGLTPEGLTLGLTIEVNGTPGCGLVLTDTGIDSMLITPTPGTAAMNL